MEIVTFLISKKYITEINAQPKIFDKNLKKIILNNPPKDFNLDLHLMLNAKENKYNIVDIPVKFKKEKVL